MREEIFKLLEKYDKPTPRYTSYPAVPHWNTDRFTLNEWHKTVSDAFTAGNGEVALYVHLPYCEKLCTFCACNKKITTNHQVEDPYINAVLEEWRQYLAVLPGKPTIREIHFGGGTPSFFSPSNLEKLVKGLLEHAAISEAPEFGIEVHPNYTTELHLETLSDLGFNRLSMGVQDFDPKVQHIINRHQTFEQTERVVAWAVKYGYSSINIDLIYGLPLQSVNSISKTIRQIESLMPHRIAFYSYAHVPWKSRVQRLFTESDLPKAKDKWDIYYTGRLLLQEAGFHAIGMDHFALPDDEMFKARQARRLHRNFMGYTTSRSGLLIGLGASAISDTGSSYAQNDKKTESYKAAVTNKLPIERGHIMTDYEQKIQRLIIDLMCYESAVLDSITFDQDYIHQSLSRLKPLQEDGLLNLSGTEIKVTETGSQFLRNICAALDPLIYHQPASGPVFSRAI
jgi:oxygen-independent coproporphyrinogen III oxidase